MGKFGGDCGEEGLLTEDIDIAGSKQADFAVGRCIGVVATLFRLTSKL